MRIFCELAETISERFSQEMENLQGVFATYLHSNLRTFLNNSEVLHEAKLCYQNLKENDFPGISNSNMNNNAELEKVWLKLGKISVQQDSKTNPQLFSNESGGIDLEGTVLY